MAASGVLRSSVRFHVDAIEFLFDALRHTQEMLGRTFEADPELDDFDEEQVHITGRELLEGIRDLALQQYGLMARHVFASWGITTTEDFGRIVFDLVDQGKMRKTDSDQLSDFYHVYDFEQALDRDYQCPVDFARIKK